MDRPREKTRKKISLLTSREEEEENKKYECIKTFEFFKDNRVPRSVSYHRSTYLHTLNVLIEDLLSGGISCDKQTLEKI